MGASAGTSWFAGAAPLPATSVIPAVAVSSTAAVSAPGSVGAWGPVYSAWWTGRTGAGEPCPAGSDCPVSPSSAAAPPAVGALCGAAAAAGPPLVWACADRDPAGPASDHWVSHSDSSCSRRSSRSSTGEGPGSISAPASVAVGGAVRDDADESAGSAAVAGAAGSAGRPKPAAVGMPVVAAASAEAATLPPSKAPSDRVLDAPGGTAGLLRFSSHQMTAPMTTMRMIQKTMSMAGLSVQAAGCPAPTLRRAGTAVQRRRRLGVMAGGPGRTQASSAGSLGRRLKI